jgi:cytochrome P450
VDSVRELREKSWAHDGVFWLGPGHLAVFDPDMAERINALNSDDLILPDRLSDAVRGRTGEPFDWREIRKVWTGQLRRINGPDGLRRLWSAMGDELERRTDRPRDLAWVAQEVVTRSLVPVVIDGLSRGDLRRIHADQDFKLARLMVETAPPASLRRNLRSLMVQVRAGNVVRRELRGRLRGSRPRRLDMTDPVVDLTPRLGLDRAVDAVTTVLSAISGPPGAAAAAVFFELVRRPQWAERLRAELAAVDLDELFTSPLRAAPTTHRFVKEILRMWSPPVLMGRPVRNDIDLCPFHLQTGDRFVVSTYFVHHDPRHWQEPESFDPDRWLPGAPHGPTASGRYVPFGWAPKSCLGGALGLLQLVLLCHLVSTRFRLFCPRPEAASMVLAAIPLPLDLDGKVESRSP